MLKPLRFRWLTDSSAWRRLAALVARYPKSANTLWLLSLWCLVNAILNVRAPMPEPHGAYLLPSIDSSVLLAAFAFVGMLSTFGARKFPWLARLRVPAALLVLVGVLLVLARVYRLGDGIAQTFQSRPVNLFIDSPMLGELVRLLYTTMPLYQFVLVIACVVVIVPLLVWLCYKCCERLALLLRQPFLAGVFVAITAVFCGISALLPKDDKTDKDDPYRGAFAASLVPRLRGDYKTFVQAKELDKWGAEALSWSRRNFARTSADLSKLEGANVLLFVVESYGATLLTRPFYADGVNELYASLTHSFDGDGYHYASGLLDSPTNGGLSWLAHSTLLTGVRVTNQAIFNFVTKAEPKGLVHYFREAGYYTISAEPATTRKIQGPDLLKFETVFTSVDYDYLGPRYTWAPMPDQLVVDKIHRKFVANATRPLFIKYALVSSHGPWSMIPPMLDDWSSIGDGDIYNHVENIHYPTSWTNLSEAHGPYLHSVKYSMEVIRRYLHDFIKDGSLIIILGDHQPTGQITDQSKDTRVPIHIVSRNEKFVQKFIKRGYVQGMRPDLDRKASGMENFPGDLAFDFSAPKPKRE